MQAFNSHKSTHAKVQHQNLWKNWHSYGQRQLGPFSEKICSSYYSDDKKTLIPVVSVLAAEEPVTVEDSFETSGLPGMSSNHHQTKTLYLSTREQKRLIKIRTKHN